MWTPFVRTGIRPEHAYPAALGVVAHETSAISDRVPSTYIA
jgi:hypothetical protein